MLLVNLPPLPPHGEYFFCLDNETNTKKYYWSQVLKAWVINRKFMKNIHRYILITWILRYCAEVCVSFGQCVGVLAVSYLVFQGVFNFYHATMRPIWTFWAGGLQTFTWIPPADPKISCSQTGTNGGENISGLRLSGLAEMTIISMCIL